MGVTADAVHPSFWEWFAGEYTRAMAAGGDEEYAFFKGIDIAGDITAETGRRPVGLFRTVLPQQVSRVRAMVQDDSWHESDDYCIDWICHRVFEDDFMPDAEVHTVEGIASHLGIVRHNLDDLVRRALGRLVRRGDVVGNPDGTYQGPDADVAVLS